MTKLAETKDNSQIPTALQYIGGGIITLNALFLGLWGLGLLVQIFSASVIIGIIMLVTVVGFIPFVPMYVGFASLGWIENIPSHLSKFEYWTKVILLFIAGIILPYITFWLATLVTLMIVSFLSGFIK